MGVVMTMAHVSSLKSPPCKIWTQGMLTAPTCLKTVEKRHVYSEGSINGGTIQVHSQGSQPTMGVHHGFGQPTVRSSKSPDAWPLGAAVSCLEGQLAERLGEHLPETERSYSLLVVCGGYEIFSRHSADTSDGRRQAFHDQQQ